MPRAGGLAFELVARGTPAEGAELVLEHVAAAGICRACGSESELDAFPLVCAACGGWELDIVRGEELAVDSLELEEALLTTGGTGYGD